MIKIINIYFILTFLCFNIYSSTLSNKIIAICPFENLTNNHNLDWLKEGISESLINKLLNSKEIILVERNRIKNILDEHKLTMSPKFPRYCNEAGGVRPNLT